MAIVFPKLWELCALGLHLSGFLIDKTLVMLVWGPAGGFLLRSWERTAINVQQTFKCMRSYVLITWPAVWPSEPLQRAQMWVEAGRASKNLTMNGTAPPPTTKYYPAPNIGGIGLEKLCFKSLLRGGTVRQPPSPTPSPSLCLPKGEKNLLVFPSAFPPVSYQEPPSSAHP